MKIITLKTITMLCVLFSYNLQASTNWIPISVGDITIIIPYVPDSIIYEDAQGNLYVKLTASHGGKLLKLTKSLYWASSEIQQNEWDELSLTVSEYSISYGNFLGDSAQDLKIIENDVEIIVENRAGSYVVSLPAESPDDGTIGSIDADDNGIRDDVEVNIAKLAPVNSLKNGYLQHTAFYTRAFLLETSNVNKKRFLTEMMKGYACLQASSTDEEAYAQVVAGHLDSKERFERYTHNNSFLNQESITVNNMDCVLKGTGVEPISGCFDQINFRDSINSGQFTYYKDPGLLLGENVNLTISIENEDLINHDSTFDFYYTLDGVIQHTQDDIPEGGKYEWVIENYLLENDGYLNYRIGDSKGGGSVYVLTISCESNQ